MKSIKPIAIALLGAVATLSAQAQSANKDGWYGEIGYLSLRFSDQSEIKPTPKLARFVIGKNYSEYLALEAMAATTMSKDSWSTSSGFQGNTSGTTYGVMLKPKYEIANGTEIFGRLGYGYLSPKSDYSYGNNSGTGSPSATSAIYGVGIQTDFSKNVYGQIDYMSYGGKDSWKGNGYTFSLGFRF
jgi:hypothetical protein